MSIGKRKRIAMGKCRCHHVPNKGSFQIGAEYEYSYGIDFIGVTDNNKKRIDFDEYTFLWYFSK